MLKLNNSLVKEYEKLVYSIIKKYQNESNKEDLFQEGMMGVIDALNNYDEESNTKFSTFAYMHILGRVLRTIRNDRNMKIGRELIKDYRNILLVKERFYKSNGRTASNEEISKILNINIDRVEMAIKYNERELSLNKVIIDGDKEVSLEDTIYNKEDIDEIDRLCLKDAINELDREEKELIYKRYFENRTQSEIASEKNINQVKVYRLERKILDKLKNRMSV